MEDIIQRLGISLGAASQGLKVLKGMQAVKSNHMIGKRREYFTAEFELEDLINRYLRVEFSGYLKNWKNHQASIRAMFMDNGKRESQAHLEARLAKLEHLHTKSEALMKRVSEEFEN